MKNFDIQTYMTNGVEKIVKEAIKATLKNPKESIFIKICCCQQNCITKKS